MHADSPEQLARRMYRAWNDDDWDTAVAYLDQDVEWRTSGVFPGFDPVYRGHAGVRRFWDAMKEAWTSFTIEIERAVERADTVVVAVHFDAIGRESGVRVELDFAHVWVVRGGRLVHYESHADLRDALRSAGLEEPAAG